MASKINADEFVDREGEGKPTLPQGVVLSGVTTITTAVVAENEVANSTGINVGIITSTHFAGNLTGDVNAGIVTVTSQSVIGSGVTISASGIDIGAGVITATSYAGGGGNLTGIGATIMIWEYNPDPYLTGLPLDTGIGITFNQKIKAGSGNITLSIANAGVAGTVVENFGIGNSVTISGNELSFTPTSNLTATRDYCITLPSGVITNMAGDNYVGTAYTFQARAYTYQLYTWGWCENGDLGLNQAGPTAISSPTQIPGTTWSNLGGANSKGTNFGYFGKSDGTLWTFGQNDQGQLAQNNKTSYSSPVQIGSDTTWGITKETLFAGFRQGYSVKTDGTLWAWGDNGSGQLGQNDKTDRSSPVQVGSGTDWSKCVGGVYMGGGIKTDGSLWLWGRNQHGQLGQNQAPAQIADYSSPVQIPGTTWNTISTGANSYCFATKTDGTAWWWGQEEQGDSGLNNPVNSHRSSPTQIPGTTWSNIVASGGGMGFKTDGTLWTWGGNWNGSLGHNQAEAQLAKCSSPIQVGTDTTWSDGTGATGSHWRLATKTDNTLWSWGGGTNGSTGLNNRTNYSSPTQVPGTDWYSISFTYNSPKGLKRS